MWFTPLLQGAAQQQAATTGYRSISSAVGSNVQFITGSLPSGTQPTDLLVAVLARVLPQIPIVPPAGWTRQTIPGLVDERLVIYTASGAATDFTWVWNANNDVVLQIAAFSGRSRNISGLALLQEDANTSFIAPSVTAAANDSLMVVMWEWQRTNQLPDPTPSISVKSSLSALNGPASLIAIADNLSAGPTGNYTTAKNAYYTGYGIQLLLPAASTTPAFYIPPKRWTRQPQGAVEIDWSNPLTRGLQCALSPYFEHVKNRRPTYSGTMAYGTSAFGRSLKGNNAGLAFVPVSGVSDPMTMLYAGSINRTANPNLVAGLGSSTGSQVLAFQFSTTQIGNKTILRQTSGDTNRFFNNNLNTVSAAKVALCAVATGASLDVYWNGTLDNGSISIQSTGDNSAFDRACLGGIRRTGNTNADTGTDGALFCYWNRALTASEIASISANPWQIFKPVTRTIGAVISGVTISRPSSDITTTGWTASSGAVLYDMIDESVASDVDYIISPSLSGSPGPAVFGLSSTLDAGTYNVRTRARRTGTTGQIRALLLDASGTTVGTGSWQALTQTPITYELSVTTSGTAARVRIEVQQ